MGLALNMYLDDTKAYPYVRGAALPGGSYWEIWPDALRPYYPLDWTNRSYHCPAYQGQILNQNGNVVSGSYSYNSMGVGLAHIPAGDEWWGLGCDYVQAGGPPPVKASDVLAPSDMFAIMDCRDAGPSQIGQQGFFGNYETECVPVGLIGGSGIGKFQQPQQHGQRFNVLFCDSHVLAIKIADLFNPTNTAVSWNHDHQPHPEEWE